MKVTHLWLSFVNRDTQHGCLWYGFYHYSFSSIYILSNIFFNWNLPWYSKTVVEIVKETTDLGWVFGRVPLRHIISHGNSFTVKFKIEKAGGQTRIIVSSLRKLFQLGGRWGLEGRCSIVEIKSCNCYTT